MNSLPKTVTGQHHDYDLNPGPSVSESSTLITRLPSHLPEMVQVVIVIVKNMAPVFSQRPQSEVCG